MALIVQGFLLSLGLAYAARVGWAGPKFERSLTGDSRSEVLWHCGLLVTAALLLLLDGWWPEKVRWAWVGLVSLAMTIVLARSYTEAYRWTGELSPKARRVMESASHLPQARRMIRCCIWTTLALVLAAQCESDVSLVVIYVFLGSFLFWLLRGWQLVHLAVRTHIYGHTPWDDTTGEFDVFLSYRRLNANVVRRIAEELAVRGIRVWFDEYVVLARDRRFLEQRLRDGVEKSRNMAVFSNDSYAQSPWCCHSELDPFLAKFGAVKVIPVGMPREAQFLTKYGNVLNGCDWIVFPRNDLLEHEIAEAALHLAASLTSGGAPDIHPDTLPEESNRVEVLADECIASLDLAGFKFLRPFDREMKGIPAKGINLKEVTSGFSDFYACHHRGALVAVEFSAGYEFGPQRTMVPVDKRLSDTELMEYTRDFAADFLEECGHRDVGVHTVIAFGFRHFAVSYWNTSVGAWARKYSVILPHPRSQKNFEVVVTFTHFGQFVDFLVFAQRMDAMVNSLQIR